jgi:glutamate-5-semialdehyde dehydrogenase
MLDVVETGSTQELMAGIGRRARAAGRTACHGASRAEEPGARRHGDAVRTRRQEILDANRIDVEAMKATAMTASFVDRGKLDDSRIEAIKAGMRTLPRCPIRSAA